MKTEAVSGKSFRAAAAPSSVALALLCCLSVSCGDDDDVGPVAATPTVAPTPEASFSPTAVATPTPTRVATSSPVPPTATASSTAARSSTPASSSTPAPSQTPPPPATQAATATPLLATVSPSASATAVSSASPTPRAGIFADLGEPLPVATTEQLATFDRGRDVARRVFSRQDGLGPDFNVVSCAHCHEKPVTGGGGARYRDFLLVQQVLDDGSSIPLGANGVQPQFTLNAGGRRMTDDGTNLQANRNPIPFFGVGLLAEISEEEILRREDVLDADGDGISGRANYDRGFVGRFGRKSQTVSIEGFIRGPLFNHFGITSDPLPDERKALLPVPSAPEEEEPLLSALLDALSVQRAYAQVAAPEEPTVDDDGVPDPELSEDDLFDLVSFAMLLAAPQPDEPTAQSESGARVFAEIGCDGCHVPYLEGLRGPVPAYSDLLVHDMGEELADGISMGLASGSEFRTQPLWGVTAVAPYLHDGRADTLDQAIRMHGGEGAASRDAYVARDAAAQRDLIAFLESLGGSRQRSEGLLPPDAAIPDAGTLGGPATALSPEEEEMFELGRAVFDRDVPIDGGLGPIFNGDSCRACHFQPVIGGAGAADVDVVRHGHLEDGVFRAPQQGTMAPRHSTAGVRPQIDEEANVFETRQTPPVFGLGFLESIPEADVLANADCDNPDPTAVSGCAHILPSGELGRLGWKANVPNLAEFARDAMFNELGMTLPEIEGQSFGAVTDSDAAADPELSVQDLRALVFFMQRLAPPRRRSTDAQAEAAGETVFHAIGCGDCHLGQFASPEGVVAYTDLLLHQVAPDGGPGIADGDAGVLEIRTPPLWGLSLTPPYMHDGRAFTVEEAVLRHDAEAASSRQSFEALSEDERESLMAFLRSL